ncbi:MAG: head fiber protein, partial [Mucinivorans sp.]
DFATRKAKAVKNVRVAEALIATDTTLKIAKGSLAYVGMFLGDGSKGATVSAIDKANANYDVLTISALGATASVGDVLFEASAAGGTTPRNKANFLNYARVKVEAGATVTAIGQAFEIKEPKLATPISEKDKASLGDRFMFV